MNPTTQFINPYRSFSSLELINELIRLNNHAIEERPSLLTESSYHTLLKMIEAANVNMPINISNKDLMLTNCKINSQLVALRMHQFNFNDLHKKLSMVKAELESLSLISTIKVKISNYIRQMIINNHFQVFSLETNQKIKNAYTITYKAMIQLAVKIDLPISKDYLKDNELVQFALKKSPLLIFSLEGSIHTEANLLAGFKEIGQLSHAANIDWILLKTLIEKYPELKKSKEFFLGIIPYEENLGFKIGEIPFISDEIFVREAAKKSKKYLPYLSSAALNDSAYLNELIKEKPEYLLLEDIPNWKNVLDSAYNNFSLPKPRTIKEISTNLIDIALEAKPNLLGLMPHYRINNSIIKKAVLEGYIEGVWILEKEDREQHLLSWCLDYFIYQLESAKDAFFTFYEHFYEHHLDHYNSIIDACLEYLKMQNISLFTYYKNKTPIATIKNLQIVFSNISLSRFVHLPGAYTEQMSFKQEISLTDLLLLQNEVAKKKKSICTFHEPFILHTKEIPKNLKLSGNIDIEQSEETLQLKTLLTQYQTYKNSLAMLNS